MPRAALLLPGSVTTDAFTHQEQWVEFGDTQLCGQEVSLGGQPCSDVPSQTLSVSCWPVPTLRVIAALSPSAVRVDGLVAAPCHVGRVHLRSGLVPLSVGRSCSSDPRWPWRMRATTVSCAGSRRGPGAGESLPAPWSRSPDGGRS